MLRTLGTHRPSALALPPQALLLCWGDQCDGSRRIDEALSTHWYPYLYLLTSSFYYKKSTTGITLHSIKLSLIHVDLRLLLRVEAVATVAATTLVDAIL